MTLSYQSIDELPAVAAQIIAFAGTEKIWFFDGPMAAGKTTLIKEIASQLGVHDYVSSPTYSLVNEYESTQLGTIYHFDFYRLKTEEEALDYGLYDYFDSGNICLCEWPDKILSFWPASYLYIKISKTSETGRIISLQKHP